MFLTRVKFTSASLSRHAFSRATRRSHSSQSPLREYFVLVWDKPGADRLRVGQCDFPPPFYAFAGEILEPVSPEQPLKVKVIGNGFSCYARSVDHIKAEMASSVYNREGVWNLNTASISPLMTVHSTPLDAKP